MFYILSGIADRLALGTGLQPSALSIENQVKTVAEQTLNQITSVIDSIKSHDLESETTTAVVSFIQRELVFFQNLLGDAVKEIELLISACSGHVAFTPDLFNLASSLGHHRAPSRWLVKNAKDVSLAGWLVGVGKQVKALCGYLLPSPLQPCSYCLGAFAHPQAFFACVLMDHARSTMKSVYALEFSVEVIILCEVVNRVVALHKGRSLYLFDRTRAVTGQFPACLILKCFPFSGAYEGNAVPRFPSLLQSQPFCFNFQRSVTGLTFLLCFSICLFMYFRATLK